MKKFKFNDEIVIVKETRYNNGRPCLQLFDSEGFPYATATINVSKEELDTELAVIKDYSENEGMYEFLLRHNIVSLPMSHYETGFVSCPVALIFPEEEWEGIRDVEWEY
jgi:hypothetical protein